MDQETDNETLKDTQETSSTPANDDNQEQSSSSEQDAKETMTPLERAMSIVDASSASVEKKTAEGDSREGQSQEVALTSEKKPEAKSAKNTNTQQQEVIDSSKQGDERFDKIPRFKELIDWKKANEPLVQRQQQLDSWKQQYNITDGELAETHGFLTALKSGDYTKVHHMLTPLYTKLSEIVGEVIPQDLQAAVDEGKIQIEYARELAKTRASASQTSGQLRQQSQQQLQASRQVAINTWSENVKKNDPDWDKKSGLVNQTFLTKWAMKQDASPAELAAMCQQAYEEVNGQIKQFVPAPPERKLPSQTGSTNKNLTVPKDPFERAMQIANFHYQK